MLLEMLRAANRLGQAVGAADTADIAPRAILLSDAFTRLACVMRCTCTLPQQRYLTCPLLPAILYQLTVSLMCRSLKGPIASCKRPACAAM